DQATARWDPEALAAAEIDEARLFPLRDWTEARRGLRAPWAMRWPALRGVDWLPAVGDGAAGNVGSDCIDPSRVALNVGTSAALRVVTTDPPEPRRGLWRYRLDRRRALLGGATSEGGNVYAWCRQILKLPGDAEVEAALAELPAAGHGLTVLPHWAGERAPGWRGDRVGVIAGLRLDTTALELTRAALSPAHACGRRSRPTRSASRFGGRRRARRRAAAPRCWPSRPSASCLIPPPRARSSARRSSPTAPATHATATRSSASADLTTGYDGLSHGLGTHRHDRARSRRARRRRRPPDRGRRRARDRDARAVHVGTRWRRDPA